MWINCKKRYKWYIKYNKRGRKKNEGENKRKTKG